MRNYNVYGIGNAIIDIQLQISEEVFQTLGLEKGAMSLVDTEEQLALLSKFPETELNKVSGGSAANSMIALAQLGGKAAYGCLIADDEMGKFYATEMKDLGITVYTTPTEGGDTGTSVILITPDAERTMNTYLGVSAEFGPEHVSSRLVGESEWLFIEGYLFSTPRGQEAVKKALSYAGKRGTKVAVVFSDGFIVDVFGEHLRAAVKYSDLIMANFNEASRFTGESEEEKIVEALKDSAPSFVLTKGKDGARVFFDGQDVSIKPVPTKAIDETGAGDMFAGAFLYGVSNGLSLEDSGNLASRLASKIVSQLGPRYSGDLSKEV